MKDYRDEWWFPKTQEEFLEQARKDFPESTEEMSDKEVLNRFGSNDTYPHLWQNIAVAYEQFEKVSDAFRELLNEKDQEEHETTEDCNGEIGRQLEIKEKLRKAQPEDPRKRKVESLVNSVCVNNKIYLACVDVEKGYFRIYYIMEKSMLVGAGRINKDGIEWIANQLDTVETKEVQSALDDYSERYF